MRQRFFLALLVMLSLLFVQSHAWAQARSVFWERWDVVIDNIDTTDNTFTVTEIYDVEFTGTFRFGSAVIPYTNLDDIRNIEVSENGEPLRASCSQQTGTFCASRDGNELSITYYFNSPVTNNSRDIEISYDVVGALRIYEGGDQLWWDAIPSEHYGYTIGASTITVELPPGFAPREGIDPVVTYGASSDVQVNGTTVVATANEPIEGDQSFSIRVQYPHDPEAQPPRWQANFDQQRAFEENVAPLLNIGLIALSLLIAVGGSLLLYTRYQNKGRDPQVGPVPTYLTEPPSNLPPGVVGSLVDERVDLRDIMSTLIDLAHRGYLVIEETRTEGLFGIGFGSEFTFKRTDKPDADLHPFEQWMLRQVFNSGMERTLNSMRNTFYTAIPILERDLYAELVDEGLFVANPKTTRNSWSALGIFLIVGAVFALIIAISLVEMSLGALMCVPFAIGIVGVVALIVAQAMPARTRKGAEETAKWKAFEEYLRNLEKYQGVEEAAKHFDAYLPYAVAFGLDRSWMQRFSRIDNVPIPPWYFPTYLGGPYSRGYIPGTAVPGFGGGGLPGELARAGDGGLSLDNMSGNLAAGLESMSAGLTQMLDSAGRIMTSQPQAASSGSSGSWRSGGSSWSGGGFSGGGGSGGGSRGFG